MISIFGICIAGLALCAMPSTAIAAGITYDCDTAADHFSELTFPAGSARFSVTGKVQLRSLVGSKTYVPLARLQIAAPAEPGQSPAVYAGFALGALSIDPKKSPTGSPAIQTLSYSVSGKEDDILPMSLMTKPGTVQPFTLLYDGSAVTVTLGSESKSFPLRTAAPTVRLVCSTGEFLFTDLIIAPTQQAGSGSAGQD